MRGVTPITVYRVKILISEFYEWGNHGCGLLDGAELYLHAAAVLRDLEEQMEPIGGRYIDADDRWAILHAMENIHAQVIKIPCTIRADEDQTYRELNALYEHLMKKWEVDTQNEEENMPVTEI